MLKLIIPALILLLTAAPQAHPGTITVRPDGTGDYPTIQDAIDAAVDGDTIVIAEGTYTGRDNRYLSFDGKAITVRSTEPNDPAVVAETIIDCQEAGRGFSFTNNEQSNSVLAGLTIINARVFPTGPPWHGSAKGAIYCDGSSPTIRNCIIKYYSAAPRVYGGPEGAITCRDGSAPTIRDCIICQNSSGALHCENSSPTIKDCIISQNEGGIYCIEGSLTLKDCTVSDNVYGIECGGGSCNISDCVITGNTSVGIGCHQCTGTISLSTITDNQGDNHGGIFCADSNLVITDCTISGNSGSGIGCWSPYYSVLTVRDCNITSNIARWGGAFYYAGPVDAKITGCKITGNWAEDGGAISCYKASPTIRNCEIAENIAKIIDCSGSDQRGGAIYCRDSSPQIINCTITGNKADEGGAIYCLESSVRVDMCTISGNRSLAEGDPPGPIRGGGGVYCEDASLTVTDTTMADNSADGNFSGGGAILCRGSTQLEITDCTIRGNSAKIRGGGICCDEETVATITGCKIIGNSSEGYSGGIGCGWDTQTKIHNCLVTGNSAKDAGGISYASRERPDITNCTIANNIARDGYGGGIVIMTPKCDAALENCILWGNSAEDGDQIALVGCPCSRWCSLTANYCNIEGGPEAVYTVGYGHWELEWDNGNIDADPCFVEPGYWDVNGVWVDGDYRLLPTSPCIDAGDPNYIGGPNETDLDGNPRILDGDEDGVAVVDMGVYEFWPPVEAEMTLTPHALSCASKGRWVKAHIVLPEGFLPEDVDINTPAVALPMDVESEYMKVFAGGKGPVSVEIAFNRRTFCEALSDTDNGVLEVTVTGSLATGQYFYATDTIKIKANPRQTPPKFQKTPKQCKRAEK